MHFDGIQLQNNNMLDRRNMVATNTEYFASFSDLLESFNGLVQKKGMKAKITTLRKALEKIDTVSSDYYNSSQSHYLAEVELLSMWLTIFEKN